MQIKTFNFFSFFLFSFYFLVFIIQNIQKNNNNKTPTQTLFCTMFKHTPITCLQTNVK